MKSDSGDKIKFLKHKKHFWTLAGSWVIAIIVFFAAPHVFSKVVTYKGEGSISENISGVVDKIFKDEVPVLDKVAYDKKLLAIANNPIPVPPKPITKIVTDPETGEKTTVIVEPEPQPAPVYKWPTQAPYPNPGAILPFNRIIAYYGNLSSTKMGVLGEYPEEEMLSRLDAEIAKWNAADPETLSIPALHYIAVVAHAAPGKNGKYIGRMSKENINKVIEIAKKRNAIVFLDVQVGLSDIQTELPLLEEFLKLPNVHFGLDPEFSMKTGAKPGTRVGTYDATDINYVIEYLANLVRENNLPPKVLVVHRYTQKMMTNYQNIKPLPEVQVVIHMDGWGGAAKKINTYKQFVHKEPVQFAGFKLFYKNDVFEKGTVLMTPEQLLKLNPIPLYIQYQ